MKKIYIREGQLSKQLLLPDFLFKAVKDHQTSLGDNPAFPGEDDYPFDYVILKERYNDVCLAMKDVGIEITDTDSLTSLLSSLVTKCKELEKPVRDSLEKICENAVNKMFAIPEGAINLKCKLVDKVKFKTSIGVTPEDSNETKYQFKDIDEKELSKKAIAKRRFINSLIMGASKGYSSSKLFYESDIAKINQELPQLYDQIMTINEYLLFTTQEVLEDENPKQGSYVEVHLGTNGGKSNIEAQGVIFPLLLHDTVKGLFELFSVYGLPKDKQKAQYIIRKSDFILAEPWDMRLGVKMWDMIFGGIGDSNIVPYVFMELISLPGDEFNIAMREILSGTQKGEQIMKDMLEKATYNSGYQEFKNRINVRNVDKSVIADSYFTAAELDGFELDGDENDDDVITEEPE